MLKAFWTARRFEAGQGEVSEDGSGNGWHAGASGWLRLDSGGAACIYVHHAVGTEQQQCVVQLCQNLVAMCFRGQRGDFWGPKIQPWSTAEEGIRCACLQLERFHDYCWLCLSSLPILSHGTLRSTSIQASKAIIIVGGGRVRACKLRHGGRRCTRYLCLQATAVASLPSCINFHVASPGTAASLGGLLPCAMI